MRDDLDFSLLAEATDLVRRGDKALHIKCGECQGHSLPGLPEDHPGHCQHCDGLGIVFTASWKVQSIEGKLDYWQARALMAEAKLAEKPK